MPKQKPIKPKSKTAKKQVGAVSAVLLQLKDISAVRHPCQDTQSSFSNISIPQKSVVLDSPPKESPILMKEEVSESADIHKYLDD